MTLRAYPLLRNPCSILVITASFPFLWSPARVSLPKLLTTNKNPLDYRFYKLLISPLKNRNICLTASPALLQLFKEHCTLETSFIDFLSAWDTPEKNETLFSSLEGTLNMKASVTTAICMSCSRINRAQRCGVSTELTLGKAQLSCFPFPVQPRKNNNSRQMSGIRSQI